MAIHDKALSPDHPNRAVPAIALGNLLVDQNRATDAEPILRRAVEVADKKNAPKASAALEKCLAVQEKGPP